MTFNLRFRIVSYLCCIFCFGLLTFSFVCSDSDSSPPVRIVYPTTPRTVLVQQSQSLTLECIVSGSPPPAAKWFKNGKEVTPGPSHRPQHNNLAFVTVTRSDEGIYTCAAETEQGTVISANYTVNVLGKKKTRKGVGTVCSRPHGDVKLSASPPQSLCLSWRA